MRLLNLKLFFIVLLLIPASFTYAIQKDATVEQEETDPFDDAWKKLAKVEPDCTEAVLFFAKRPEETLKYFGEHLAALRLDEETFQALLADLGSDDEKIAESAFLKFQYRDPRLFMGLEEIMETVEENPARSRMVEVLTSRPFDSMAGEDIQLRRTNGGGEEEQESFNFTSGGSSFWAEAQVSRLGTYVRKPEWARATRAIMILEDNGSVDAVSFLARMAQGHKDAQPTQLAKKIAMRIKLEKAKENR